MSMKSSATLNQEGAGPPQVFLLPSGGGRKAALGPRLCRALPAAVAAAVLCASLLPAPVALAQAANARARGDAVTLNFVNAEIEGVARAMSAILKQQFVVDPRVKGSMTLYSPPTSTTVKPSPRSAARKLR